ncbi:MAG: FTR1 family protein [Anaerolineae bacterium]
MRRFIVLLLSVCTLTLFTGGISAAAQEGSALSPSQSADEVRRALFDAQVDLMRDARDDAQANVTRAAETASSAFEAFAPSLRAKLDDLFTSMQEAASAGDQVTFAGLRSAVWTTLLQGGMQVVFNAIENGDGDTAARWLPLREFRPSNRFSRPNADATLAIAALRRGTIDAETALAAVQHDLYDTYQGQLTAALSAIDEAHANRFAVRQAEEAGYAAGYFDILADAYAAQRSVQAMEAARAQFAQLVSLSGSDNIAAYAAARGAVDTAILDFRAAPLTEEEIARRAGQVMRYIALIPVEYSRAIRDGQVANTVELQEAITFYEGAIAAFADLHSTLNARDAAATAQAEALLTQTRTQIDTVADPAAVQTGINDLNAVLQTLIPAEWISAGGSSDIDVIVSILDGIIPSVAAGDYQTAESARLEAYAMLELGIEQRLRGFAPDKAAEIEGLFWQGTADVPGLSVLLTTDAPVDQVSTSVTALKNAFADASLLLGVESSPAAVATNAAIIVFREGLEAVLILASLIASLRSAQQRRYRQPLVIGAVLAFAATVVTWIVAGGLLNLLLPLGERLEAIVSLIAIGVLLLITNWFFHKSYWTGWMANFHSRKQRLIGGIAAVSIGQTVGLILLGFTSIYREGFETVLFLQSLVLEAGTSVVIQGVLLGLVGTALVGVVTFALQVRLPYKKMLIVTGVFIGVVLLTMVGNTVHVMQSVGWLPITPVQGLYLPFWMGQWFGVFATWQGLILQVVAGGFVIGSYFLAEHQQKRTRTQTSAPQVKTAAPLNRGAGDPAHTAAAGNAHPGVSSSGG